MRLVCNTICVGMFFSLLFGAVGGFVGGGLSLGVCGFFATVTEHNPATAIGVGIFAAFLGAIWGSFVGLIGGAIGWLPALLFPRDIWMSLGAAALLSAVVGIFFGHSHVQGGGVADAGFAYLLVCCISGGVSSNAMVHRWLEYRLGEFAD